MSHESFGGRAVAASPAKFGSTPSPPPTLNPKQGPALTGALALKGGREASWRPCSAGSGKLARSGHQDPPGVRRAPGIILSSRAFPQVTLTGDSSTPKYQPPRTPAARSLDRKPCERASPRACAPENRREVAFALTSVRMRTH